MSHKKAPNYGLKINSSVASNFKSNTKRAKLYTDTNGNEISSPTQIEKKSFREPISLATVLGIQTKADRSRQNSPTYNQKRLELDSPVKISNHYKKTALQIVNRNFEQLINEQIENKRNFMVYLNFKHNINEAPEDEKKIVQQQPQVH